jgi:hypothetical protein
MPSELLVESQGVEDEQGVAAQALREKLKEPWDQVTPQDQAAAIEELLRRAGLKE